MDGENIKAYVNLPDKNLIKYLCFDLDGTLLNDEKKVGFISLEYIKKYKQDGVRIVLCSGRHLEGIIEYAEILGMDANDYIICCDGQYIYDGELDKIFEWPTFRKSDVKKIINNLKCDAFLVDRQHDYIYSYGNNNFFKWLVNVIVGDKTNCKKRQKINISKYDLAFKKHLVIEKIVIKDVETDVLESQYNVCKLSTGRIEILPKNVNKYNALCKLQELKLISSFDECLYFGDEYNDYLCVKNCKYSVVPETAPNELKKEAVFVAESSNSDGVGKVLKDIYGK